MVEAVGEENLPLGIVVPYRFVPPVGGGQMVNYKLSKAFADRRSTIILTSTDNELEEGLNMKRLFRYVKLNYLNPFLAIRFYLFLKKNRVSALLVNHPFLGLVLYPAKKMLGIPFYLYQHNIEYLRFKSLGKWTAPFIYYLEKFTCRYADAIFFISPKEIKEAVKLYGLSPNKCHFLPHFLKQQTSPTHRESHREAILIKHHFHENDCIALFFGPLDYAPNREAVEFINENIYPLLEAKKQAIQILICGGGIDEDLKALLHKQKNIHYLGFVEDIETYVQGADMVLAPLFRGGGVKTKVIESLEWGTTVVTTAIGAEGIAQETCGDKLIVLEEDGMAFAKKILDLKTKAYEPTPKSFYEFYHIDKILKTALDVMVL